MTLRTSETGIAHPVMKMLSLFTQNCMDFFLCGTQTDSYQNSQSHEVSYFEQTMREADQT